MKKPDTLAAMTGTPYLNGDSAASPSSKLAVPSAPNNAGAANAGGGGGSGAAPNAPPPPKNKRPRMYAVVLNVTAGQADWFPGELSINCVLKDTPGNTAYVTTFTDHNSLAGNAHTPTLDAYLPNEVRHFLPTRRLHCVPMVVLSMANGLSMTYPLCVHYALDIHCVLCSL